MQKLLTYRKYLSHLSKQDWFSGRFQAIVQWWVWTTDMHGFFMKQHIPVAGLVQNSHILPYGRFEVIPFPFFILVVFFFNDHRKIVERIINLEHFEYVVELFAFVDVLPNDTTFVGPGMFWTSFEYSSVGYPYVGATASRARHFVDDVRSV